MNHAHTQRLLLISTAYGIGGTENLVLILSEGLRKLAVEVQTVFPQVDAEMGFLTLAQQMGAHVRSSRAVRDLSVRRNYRDLIALRALVRSTGAPVVNIHFGINFISIWDVLAIRLAGVQRCIASVHHAIPLLNKRSKLMTMLASRLCHQVVVTTPAMAEILAGAGVARKKIVEVPPGIRPPTSIPSRGEARASLGLPQDALIVSSLARLVPEKGFSDLITAMAMVAPLSKPVHLVIGGDGPARKEFEAQAAAQLPNRAHFLGYIPDSTLLYAASDVFALPSHEEGFGLVFIEAAFHGIPSIGTDVGGVRYAITHNKTGILVPAHAPQELASALQQLLTNDALRQRMGLAARQQAQHQFNEENMSERYRSLLFA